LLDSKRVAWVEDGQLLRVRQAQSGVDQTESVPVALAQEGAWVEGWIHRRILATPAPKTYVPLLALQLSDSVTGQPGALRYRIVVKNETAEPAALPASKLGVFYTRPNAVGSNAVSLPPRTIPARSEAVLLDEALVETGDGFAAPFGDSRTDLFARRDPPPQSVSTRVSLEMEAPKVRLVAAEHKLTLPAGALEPAK
jgi:hypothetical protein